MTELNVLHEYGKELERRVRLQSFPLAVKLLETQADIPERAERPLRDIGYHIEVCQGYALSRKEGKTLAMFKEDMWCFEPIVGYGWVKPPEYFLEGYNRFPQDVKDLQAGKNYAADFPRLEVGRYTGVVSAPLTTAAFVPDLVMLYCNSAQLSLLLLAREYKDGHDLMCHLSSHAACVYSVVSALKTGRCHVAIPCRGDRYHALAGDNEIILTVPTQKLGDLMDGLRYLEHSGFGNRLPRSPRMMPEPQLPESYMKILKMMEGD